MKLLAVSDEEVAWINSPRLSERCADVDLVISCSDLPNDYLEYIATTLNKPCYYVHGNHDTPPAQPDIVTGKLRKTDPEGWLNLDLQRARLDDLRLAGLEGCHRYKPNAPYQYSQSDQWLRAFWLARKLAQGMARWGRGMDIMVTHAPLRDIHDGSDVAHHGFDAFNWLAKSFKPRLWLHGHQHRNYNPLQGGDTRLGETRIVNVHPYRILEF